MEEEQTKDGVATKAEIQSLLDFIGGFEKWELLNEDCRREVVKYLDYKSRCQLGLCSKSNYAIVEATPLYVYKMEMVETEIPKWMSDVSFNPIIVRIYFSKEKHIELAFGQIEQDTEISWFYQPPKGLKQSRKVIWKSKNYYDEAVKFVENWMKKCNYELEEIDINMFSYPFEFSKIRMLPKCKNVRIVAKDGETIRWRLKRVPDQLAQCSLDSSKVILQEFCDHSKIQQTTDYLDCQAQFSDEQLLKLRAMCFSIDTTNIIEAGINKFMKKLINNGIPHFKSTGFWRFGTGSDDKKITEGLRFREWKDDFEMEEKAFCDEYWRKHGHDGNGYQIKSLVVPFESFTLYVTSNRVSIFRTGTM